MQSQTAKSMKTIESVNTDSLENKRKIIDKQQTTTNRNITREQSARATFSQAMPTIVIYERKPKNASISLRYLDICVFVLSSYRFLAVYKHWKLPSSVDRSAFI